MYLLEVSSVSSLVMCNSNMYGVVFLGNSVIIVLFSFLLDGYRDMFVRRLNLYTKFICDYGSHELDAQ